MIFLKEFLDNPAGKGTTFLNIKAIKTEYNKRYDAIVKKIKHTVYYIKDQIFIQVKIPSSVEGIMYDVILQFIPTPKSLGTTLNDMEMRIFSNSPSFLYTYAHSYQQRHIFIDEMKRKLSSKMLTDIAKTKNPYDVLSYDFSVYAALYYVVTNGYDDKKSLDPIALKSSITNLLANVRHAETLQKERSMQKNYNKLKEKEELEEKKKDIFEVTDIVPENDHQVKQTKKTKIVPEVKQVKRTKEVKAVNRVKKTKK